MMIFIFVVLDLLLIFGTGEAYLFIVVILFDNNDS